MRKVKKIKKADLNKSVANLRAIKTRKKGRSLQSGTILDLIKSRAITKLFLEGLLVNVTKTKRLKTKNKLDSPRSRDPAK